MRLIRRVRDIESFDAMAMARLDGAVFPLPVSLLGRAYYDATLGDERTECSFLIEHGGRALVVFFADVAGETLGRYGMPAELLLDRDADAEVFERALKEALGEIGRLIKSQNVLAAQVLMASPGPEADLAAGLLASAGFRPSPHLRAIVDIGIEAAQRESMLRKGHRQAVRWGKENLMLDIVDRKQPARDKFDSFRQLHCDVSGRATRNDASWNVMFEAVASGRGRLILSNLDGALVGGTLVLDSGATAVYASGAYRREHFDKPLAHYPLMVGMEKSREAGLKAFDIGDVSILDSLSAKESSIAYFKRGFTSKLKIALRWGWTAAPVAESSSVGVSS